MPDTTVIVGTDPGGDEALDVVRANRAVPGLPPVASIGEYVHVVLGEVLVEQHREAEVAGAGFRRYTPGPADWRTITWEPDRADVNRRLETCGLVLMTAPDELDALREFVTDFPDGVHLNHLLIGAKGTRPGPADAPTPVPAITPTPAGTLAGDRRADVAVLDTGLPVRWREWHPWLAERVDVGLGNLRAAPDDAVFGADPADSDVTSGLIGRALGHGLFICGLIARARPELRVSARRVLRRRQTDDATLAAELLACPEPVLSLSLSGRCDQATTRAGDVGLGAPAGLRAAVAQIIAQGRVVVAAAGNDGIDSSGPPVFPAALPGVIAVGAHDGAAEPAPADFSNRGEWIDVWAPGVRVVSAYGDGWGLAGSTDVFRGWASWSGTSFAAPLVAAEIAARVAQEGPGRTPCQVARAFLDGLPDAGFAAGRLYRAVTPRSS